MRVTVSPALLAGHDSFARGGISSNSHVGSVTNSRAYCISEA
jgi:hypothetical protein